MITYFGSFFSDSLVSRGECLALSMKSNFLHSKFVESADLNFYSEQIDLAKTVHKIMIKRFKDKKIVADIVFCASTSLPWAKISTFMDDVYGLDMHEKAICSFYYLDEICNGYYIDSPLPIVDNLSS